jgi:hypothetical protein
MVLANVFFTSILLTSCFDESFIVPVYKNNTFVFYMPYSVADEILQSRENKLYIDTLDSMTYGDRYFEVDRLSTRGGGTLNFQRKSFSVNLAQALPLQTKTGEKLAFGKFKLLAMQFDYMYIENRLAQVMLNEIALWPLHSFYTEVKLNNLHQGLYLFVEDPEEHLMNYKNADVVIRRYYRGEIDKIRLKDKTSTKREYYEEEFNNIYHSIIKYEGKQLYERLQHQMNIDAYMQKMAFDLLVENGDYTDELFFYGSERDGGVYFDILPWDYDDLFQGNPHEVGRDWAVGRLFGTRKYPTHQSVLNALQGRLIFSIEDDIDYRIATDDYLYKKYIENLKLVFSKLTPQKIDELFDLVYSEVIPFYDKQEIIEQSKFDANSTNKELLINNFTSRKSHTKQRVEWIIKQAYEQ